jgi:hypothetical protein
MICIASNASADSLSISKDEDYVLLAQRAVQISVAPTWYLW